LLISYYVAVEIWISILKL